MKAKLLKDIKDDEITLARAGRVLDLVDTNLVAIDTKEFGGEIWVEVQDGDFEIIPDVQYEPGEDDKLMDWDPGE